MVVSGLPERNGDKHVTEMAYVALDLIQAVTNFRMPHDPEGCLRIRIGMVKLKYLYSISSVSYLRSMGFF